MLIVLLSLFAAAEEIEVSPGESVRDAIHAAPTGATVRVHAGADTSGIAWVSDKSVTIRSATSDMVEISGLTVQEGGEAHLIDVEIPTRSQGAQYRALIVQRGTVTGERVRLVQSPQGGFGLFLGGGTVDIDGFIAEGFRGSSAIRIESQLDMPRSLTLSSCLLNDNLPALSVGQHTGRPMDGDVLALHDCVVSNNAHPGLGIGHIGTVTITGTRFLNNPQVALAIDAPPTSGQVTIHTSEFCGNLSLPNIDIMNASHTDIHRNVIVGPCCEVGASLVRIRGGDARLVNNTAIAQPEGPTIGYRLDTPGEVQIANNIFGGLTRAITSGSTALEVTHNLMYDMADDQLHSLDAALISQDPRFVDSYDITSCASLPHLQEHSPAIDAGIDIADLDDPVTDEGPRDIGALPFQASQDPDNGGGNNGDPLDGEELWITGGGCRCASTTGPWWLGGLAILLALARRRPSPSSAPRSLLGLRTRQTTSTKPPFR